MDVENKLLPSHIIVDANRVRIYAEECQIIPELYYLCAVAPKGELITRNYGWHAWELLNGDALKKVREDCVTFFKDKKGEELRVRIFREALSSWDFKLADENRPYMVIRDRMLLVELGKIQDPTSVSRVVQKIVNELRDEYC